MNPINRMLIPAIALLAAGSVFAEITSLDALRDDLAAKRETVETYVADMTMVMNMGGISMRTEGDVQGKGAMNVTVSEIDMLGSRMETRSVLDANGVMWTETDMMGMKQVIKMDVSDVDGLMENMGMSNPFAGAMGGGMSHVTNPMDTLEAYDQSYDLEFAGRETLDGEEVYVVGGSLNQTMRDSMAKMNEMIQDATAGAGNGLGMDLDFVSMMDSVRLHLSVADGFPRKTAILTASGTPFMEVRYANVRLNEPLDDSIFEYEAPEGVEVMDLSGMDLDSVAAGGSGADSGYNSLLQVNDAAPLFEAPTVSGELLSLETYRGEAVLIDFWATWCGPCIAALPDLIETYTEFGPKGLNVIGVSLDNSRTDVEQFLARRPAVTWPQVFDGQGWNSEVAALYGVDAIPFVLLIGRDGKVVARDVHGEELNALLETLLAE